MPNRCAAILIITLLLTSFILYKAEAKVTVDYSFDKKTILIKVDVGINKEDKPQILEVYVNGTLYETYYFKDNETFPKYIEINLNVSGTTSIAARTYDKISGWSQMDEIYVNANALTHPNINLGREIALLLGVIIIFSAFLIYFRKGSKGSR